MRAPGVQHYFFMFMRSSSEQLALRARRQSVLPGVCSNEQLRRCNAVSAGFAGMVSQRNAVLIVIEQSDFTRAMTGLPCGFGYT